MFSISSILFVLVENDRQKIFNSRHPLVLTKFAFNSTNSTNICNSNESNTCSRLIPPVKPSLPCCPAMP